MISYHHLTRQIPRGHRLTRTAVLQPLPQEETCQRWVRSPSHAALLVHLASWLFICSLHLLKGLFHLFILPPSSLLPPASPSALLPLPTPQSPSLPSLNDIILKRFQRYCAVRQVYRQTDGVYRPSLARCLSPSPASRHSHSYPIILPSILHQSYAPTSNTTCLC